MNRAERRRAEREAKKKNSNPLIENIEKFGASMKEFHENNDDLNVMDWLLTLDREDLRFFSSAGEDKEEGEETGDAVVAYLALMAHTLTTGENNLVDENPDTDQSTMYKLINTFVYLATNASLCKAGLTEVRYESAGFFDWENTGLYTRMSEKGREICGH